MTVKKYMRSHIGEESITKQGCKCIIIDGGSKNDYVTVKLFSDDNVPCIKENCYTSVKRGGVYNDNLIHRYSLKHVGEIHYNNQGCKMEIISGGSEYGSCKIKMHGGVETYTVEDKYSNVVRGMSHNKMMPKTYGYGYIGIGEYTTSKGRKPLRKHDVWKDMMRRCYGDINKPTYKEVFVCEEWHNYQNFAQWYDENYREFKYCRTELDKDFIGNGKLYSPDNCVFLPQQLNGFLTNKQTTNTTGYIGVSFHRRDKVYEANINLFPKRGKKYLGRFHDPEIASRAYKKARKEQCKIVRQKCIDEWGITDKRILDSII
jgi:hypothetical protein